MKDNKISKVNLLYRYINNSFFRLLLRKVLIPCNFMDFIKATETKIVFKYLDVKPDEKICDVACGCGEQSIKMMRKGCNIYAIDTEAKAIEIANTLSENKCDFFLANAEKLPFKAQVFDKIVSICALEHFKNDEQAIEEMNRVLKPGGILVLSVDSFTYRRVSKVLQDTHKSKHSVINYYSFPELAEKLRKHGFHVEKTKYFINSPLSYFLFDLGMRNLWLSLMLFPISYGLGFLSDQLSGKGNEGLFLAIQAEKEAKL